MRSVIRFSASLPPWQNRYSKKLTVLLHNYVAKRQVRVGEERGGEEKGSKNRHIHGIPMLRFLIALRPLMPCGSEWCCHASALPPASTRPLCDHHRGEGASSSLARHGQRGLLSVDASRDQYPRVTYLFRGKMAHQRHPEVGEG